MDFKNYEKQAILRLLAGISLADGNVNVAEDKLFRIFMLKLGITNSDIIASKDMSNSKACSIAKGLSLNQKRLISALLASIILVDGKVEESEFIALTAICAKCDIPVLDPNEVTAILDTYFK